ncbi:MAG: DUF3048 domain-containing protein [Bacillota bacterium]
MRRFGMILLCLCLLLTGCRRQSPPQSPQPSATPPAPNAVDTRPKAPLTGKPADKVGTFVAATVENSPAARPQSGLQDADLVYEVMAEGGITRFLAFYHSGQPKRIGPVRSTRPYFAVLAKEWGAVLVHCGGDPKDLTPLADLAVPHIDEIPLGRNPAFTRTSDRPAPHNLYGTLETLRTLAGNLGLRVGEPKAPWSFTDTFAAGPQQVTIPYAPDYSVTYQRVEGQGYKRLINGQPHTDQETGQPLLAANVLFLYVPQYVGFADGGMVLEQVGTGKAAYLAAGQWLEGTWAKESLTNPTKYLDAQKNPLKLFPGTTWIQIVAPTTQIAVKQ